MMKVFNKRDFENLMFDSTIATDTVIFLERDGQSLAAYNCLVLPTKSLFCILFARNNFSIYGSEIDSLIRALWSEVESIVDGVSFSEWSARIPDITSHEFLFSNQNYAYCFTGKF